MAKVKEVRSAPPLITASEIGRHLYCARALAYDRANPAIADSSGFLTLWRWLRHPFRAGILALTLVVMLVATQRVEITLIGVFVSLFLFILLRFIYRRMREPSKDIVFHGVKAHPNHKTLVARQFGLVGQPDYLLDMDGYKIPMLCKDLPSPPTPYQSHIMELIAHGMLVAENEPKHPLYGVIRYEDGRTFEVDFDEDAVEELSRMIDEMEVNRLLKDVPRNHEERRRCYACRYRQDCEESLFK